MYNVVLNYLPSVVFTTSTTAGRLDGTAPARGAGRGRGRGMNLGRGMKVMQGRGGK